MRFKCGIVGLPNVGKSTLFNALTKLNVKADNFPFCTIEPNIGIVPIPDKRLNRLSEIVRPQRIVPATMKFIDIPGLVKGASKGEGLGNQFLTKLHEVEAIGHMVRCFKNDKITHVTGTINPAEDINIVNTELLLSDINTCERAICCVVKKIKGSNRDVKTELLILEKCLSHLESSNMLRSLNLKEEERKLIRHLDLLTFKPMMYIANMNENVIKHDFYFNQVRTIAEKEGSIAIPVSAAVRADIAKLDDKECKEFTYRLSLERTDLNRVIHAGYELLNLHTYFTVGVKEVSAWTIPVGATASQAAGKIHSDLEKGFIRAQTISYEDFITHKGEQGAKKAGKVRSEGKNYIVKDGDIIHFLFNV